MGNALTNIKRILSNRNTVTILAVLLGVVVLYFAYNMRVKEAIEPVQVPCAKVEINSGTIITEDMIDYVQISKKLIKKSPGIITNESDLIGKRIDDSSSIPVNGLFYTDQLAENSEVSSIFKDIKDGFTVFTLKVNFNTTYGNSIYPGNYIDLYVEGEDDNGKLIYTKFIESFLRRFAESASLSTTYKIQFYDIYEVPPKVSVKVSSSSKSFNVFGDTDSFDIVNRIDSVLELNN